MKEFAICLLAAGCFVNTCRSELCSGNSVGYVNLDLRPGMNQYRTFFNEVGGDPIKIDQFLRSAQEGDKIVYDSNGEKCVAVAKNVGGVLRWFDQEKNEELEGARLPGDENGSDLIYNSASGADKQISIDGENAQLRDPERVVFPPPPPKVIKLALPFKTRPTGRFCMIVRKGTNMTERLIVRLSDANTIVHADTGEPVNCREQDLVGFEEFVPDSNPLADKQPNMSKEDVARIEKKWEKTVWLRQKAVEVASLLKGEEVTWSALCTSAILFTITSILGSIIAFLFNLFIRKLWAAIVFFFRGFLWEECHLNALPWIFRRLLRRIGWFFQSVADVVKKVVVSSACEELPED